MTGDTGAAPATGARLGPARLAAFGLLTLLLVSLAARLWYSSASPLSYDETHNLMIGMLANQGHAPYREIYSVIMPFSILTMQASAALWDATHHVRTLMMLYGLIGVAALYFLVYRHARSIPVLAALFAATFFSFNPHYFFVSTSINLEAGALAWGLLSVALVEFYRTRSAIPRKWRSGCWPRASPLASARLSRSSSLLCRPSSRLQLLLMLVVDRAPQPARRRHLLAAGEAGAGLGCGRIAGDRSSSCCSLTALPSSSRCWPLALLYARPSSPTPASISPRR